jgi:hypothetical protein
MMKCPPLLGGEHMSAFAIGIIALALFTNLLSWIMFGPK